MIISISEIYIVFQWQYTDSDQWKYTSSLLMKITDA